MSDNGRALITDFGTSHIASASQAATRGETKSPIGYTACWAAPELLEAAENLRPKKPCDIWSFGCLGYEVCADSFSLSTGLLMNVNRCFRANCPTTGARQVMRLWPPS